MGIDHFVSCPHTPEQNGIAERKHRHIVETGLTLLAQASMPQRFWDDAFFSGIYLINRLPSSVLNFTSPFEKLFHRQPNYNMLRIFGCQCFPNLRPYTKHKLEFRSQPCTFIGYTPHHKGYKCLARDGRVFISRDVSFNENFFPFSQFLSRSNDESTNTDTTLLH